MWKLRHKLFSVIVSITSPRTQSYLTIRTKKPSVLSFSSFPANPAWLARQPLPCVWWKGGMLMRKYSHGQPLWIVISSLLAWPRWFIDFGCKQTRTEEIISCKVDTVQNIYLSSARTFPTGLRCISLLKAQQLPYELQHELGQVFVPLRCTHCFWGLMWNLANHVL